MRHSSGAVRLPLRDESIAPVTILDGQGRVVRVVDASEFRRTQPPTGNAWRDRRRARPVNRQTSELTSR
jgi:hypothetical protein